jgi:4,5-DOPA dioxygenase extradiol
MISEVVGQNIVIKDNSRGIDHAAWAILKHIFPDQKIPVLELSLDAAKEPLYHYELGQKLTDLRRKKILFIGSGNIIHNLSDIDFDDNADPFEWAIQFDRQMKTLLEAKDIQSLINYKDMGPNALKAIPYFDHYLPMLYTLGMAGENESLKFIHESIQNGSISMRSFRVG